MPSSGVTAVWHFRFKEQAVRKSLSTEALKDWGRLLEVKEIDHITVYFHFERILGHYGGRDVQTQPVTFSHCDKAFNILNVNFTTSPIGNVTMIRS